MRWLRRILGGFALLTLVAGVYQYLDVHVPRAAPAGGPVGFDGRLIAASDVDQGFGAYANGALDRIPGAMDTLSVLHPAERVDAPEATVEATHSVVGWPHIMAVSPDGRHAYLVETRGRPAEGVDQVPSVYSAMPPGETLSIIDLSNPAAPRRVLERSIGKNLGSVEVSADGRALIVAGLDALILVELDGPARIAAIHSYPLDLSEGFPEGHTASRPGVRSAAFHPDGRHVAVNISDRQVRFYRFGPSLPGAQPSLTLVGAPLTFGETLTAGVFHPSGDFFLIPDVTWNTNSQVTDFIFNREGSIYAVRFDPAGAHELADQARVGRSPEGFALSPDGARVVTVDMNRTYLPRGLPFWLFGSHAASSLTLLSFDAESGEMTVLDQQGFDGNLPEDAVFDADGDALAVAIYEDAKRADGLGYVAYWRVEDDALVFTGVETPVARGAHDLALIP